MTLAKLKAHTDAIMIGDIKIADNISYIPLLEQALLEIANRVDCLSLVTKSSDFRVLRAIGDGNYIRKPNTPNQDIDEIDMDDELMFALSNLIASYVSNVKPQYFVNKSEEIISDYNFKIINTDLGCE